MDPGTSFSSVVVPTALRWILGPPFPLWLSPMPSDGSWDLPVLCGQPLSPQMDPGTSFSSVVGPTALRWILGPPFPLVLSPSPLRWILGPPFPLWLSPLPSDGSWDLLFLCGCPHCPQMDPGISLFSVVSPSPLRWILGPPFPLWSAPLPSDESWDLHTLGH